MAARCYSRAGRAGRAQTFVIFDDEIEGTCPPSCGATPLLSALEGTDKFTEDEVRGDTQRYTANTTCKVRRSKPNKHDSVKSETDLLAPRVVVVSRATSRGADVHARAGRSTKPTTISTSGPCTKSEESSAPPPPSASTTATKSPPIAPPPSTLSLPESQPHRRRRILAAVARQPEALITDRFGSGDGKENVPPGHQVYAADFCDGGVVSAPISGRLGLPTPPAGVVLPHLANSRKKRTGLAAVGIMPTPGLVLCETARGKDGDVVGGGRRGKSEDDLFIAVRELDGVEGAGAAVRFEQPAGHLDAGLTEAELDGTGKASAQSSARGLVGQVETEEQLLVSLLESLLLSV